VDYTLPKVISRSVEAGPGTIAEELQVIREAEEVLDRKPKKLNQQQMIQRML
jgi:hypothetical protein